jgi:uncharacterized protein YkwD
MRLRFIFVVFILAVLISSCTGNGGPAETSQPALESPSADTPAGVIPTTMPTQTATTQPPAVETPPAASSATPVAASPAAALATNTPDPTQSQPSSTAIPPTPSAAPPTPTTTTTVDPQTRSCFDQAVFVDDLTIPDGTLVSQSETFTKGWRIKNDGTCAWDENYALVFAGGENMNASLSNPVPATEPGEFADIYIDLIAPQQGGSYTGNWWLRNNAGEYFGVGVPPNGKIWVAINIQFFIPDPPSTGPVSPTPPPAPGTTPAPAPPSSPAGCPLQRDTTYEQQLLALINQRRSAQGVPELAVESRLQAAALRHSNDMACNSWTSHVGTDGSNWYARVAEAGYANYNSARENIWYGLPKFGANAVWFFNQMDNSPIHHENMFYRAATEIGIAFVHNTITEEGYITLVVARP